MYTCMFTHLLNHSITGAMISAAAILFYPFVEKKVTFVNFFYAGIFFSLFPLDYIAYQCNSNPNCLKIVFN